MKNPVHARNRNLALALLLSINCAATAAIVASAYDEVLSFDMWCLEMRLYPSARCDTRRADDVKAYEQYRATTERFDQERTARAKRDR